jgi:Asp-tRNA(Asn)/Glu-tRNA(Gln) amidotransferase A subunit family amidase
VGDTKLTTETIAAAEQVVGIEYDQGERRQMLAGMGGQIARTELRRGYMPDNGFGPAVVFDPRLPGVEIAANDGGVVPSGAPVPALPDDNDDIAYAPLTHLAGWLKAGAITSTRLTEIYLGRIERLAPALECVVTVTRDLALAQAAEADREIAAGRYRGPLHGVPWGAKDLLDTDGIRTTWGAMPFQDRVATRDAVAVRLLTEAGAVLIAKTTLGALAWGDTWFGGHTRNPWNTDEGASGSSAGSASCVSAGLVGFAIGSETLGSIVSPSERCGVTGLRPTFGRVSRVGAMALCWSTDKLGPICRGVEDTALVLAAINGHDPDDAGSIAMPFAFDGGRSAAGLRLGYAPKWFDSDDATDVDRAALDAARRIGVELVEVSIPDLPYEALEAIVDIESAAAFEDLTLDGRDDQLVSQHGGAYPNRFRLARFISAIDLIQTERLRRRTMEVLAELYGGIDAMIGEFPNGSMASITNFTGHPSLTIPAGFVERRGRGMSPKNDDPASLDDSGPLCTVPHAVNLWGRLFDEGMLCNMGMALEAEFAMVGRRPPVG